MSDTSQGEGWWQASDGKWYPPEQHPDVRQPTEAVPPTQPVPPTPAAPAGPPGGSSNKKWIIPVAVVGAVAIAVVAFLLLRNDDSDNNVATATDKSDESSDKTSSSSKSSSKSSTSAEFVDPVGVENRLLTASDIGSQFTDETFTPSTDTTDPCGNPNSRTVVPPTKDVGSTAAEESSGKVFQEEVLFHKNAADNQKGFDVGLKTFQTCSAGTVVDNGSTASFTTSPPEDVSDEVGVSEAFQSTAVVGDTTLISVGVRLDNCIVSFAFQYPTSAGESGKPDATGIAKDGIDLLLS